MYNSIRPRCFRFPGMCLPRYLYEDPSWRKCTKSCDTATYIWWSNGFVVNILLLAAFSCNPIWCSSIISTKAGKERAYNIKSSAYLIFVSRSWWSMAMLTFSLPFPHSTLQSSSEKHWTEDVTLLDSTLNIERPASMHRTTLRRVNRPQ